MSFPGDYQHTWFSDLQMLNGGDFFLCGSEGRGLGAWVEGIAAPFFVKTRDRPKKANPLKIFHGALCLGGRDLLLLGMRIKMT